MSRPTEARIVLAQSLFGFELSDWTILLIPGVGLAVSGLVIALFILYGRWRRRRRLGVASTEEDLPWDVLLELLEARSRKQAEAGLPPDDDLPPDQLLKHLLAMLPKQRRRQTTFGPDDWNIPPQAGAEKRANPRRWGNPTEVHISWLSGPERLHGLVINRSTGGLAIFVDKEVADNTMIQLRPAAAPSYVATITMEVRYCRKVGRSFFLGCQFCGDVPWNVRVWFG
jgi:hypothetical protein